MAKDGRGRADNNGPSPLRLEGLGCLLSSEIFLFYWVNQTQIRNFPGSPPATLSRACAIPLAAPDLSDVEDYSIYERCLQSLLTLFGEVGLSPALIVVAFKGRLR